MESGSEVGRRVSQKDGVPRMVARGALVVLAVFLLWAGFTSEMHTQIQQGRTFILPWGGWLKWHGLYLLAGVSLGLAMILPRRVRYRPGRALLLGAIPILWLIHLTLILGPNSAVNFTLQHLGIVARWPSSPSLSQFESSPSMDLVAGVWLGLSIAAGFGE